MSRRSASRNTVFTHNSILTPSSHSLLSCFLALLSFPLAPSALVQVCSPRSIIINGPPARPGPTQRGREPGPPAGRLFNWRRETKQTAVVLVLPPLVYTVLLLALYPPWWEGKHACVNVLGVEEEEAEAATCHRLLLCPTPGPSPDHREVTEAKALKGTPAGKAQTPGCRLTARLSSPPPDIQSPHHRAAPPRGGERSGGLAAGCSPFPL
ncbi:hypothetical protein EYF80_052204 [Liparis tanakae]|uniref:Uncharacterized protein n=1 Tax=Liparis tanakae TaxID=230148 RepID=A0A4Z2F8R8_9TELE|nr:hypothetical protein EYF80_052204 [Liparis tanakae]